MRYSWANTVVCTPVAPRIELFVKISIKRASWTDFLETVSRVWCLSSLKSARWFLFTKENSYRIFWTRKIWKLRESWSTVRNCTILKNIHFNMRFFFLENLSRYPILSTRRNKRFKKLKFLVCLYPDEISLSYFIFISFLYLTTLLAALPGNNKTGRCIEVLHSVEAT